MSTLTVSIGGTPVSIIEKSLKITSRVDDKDKCSFQIRDQSGTAIYQHGQTVSVVDSVRGTLFSGYVDKPIATKLYPSSTQTWQVDCVSQFYNVTKKASKKRYKKRSGKGYAAGAIAANQIQQYLAPDGVQGNFSLAWTEQQTEWSSATLSNTVAATNLTNGNPGGGDLELATAGVRYTSSGVSGLMPTVSAIAISGYASSVATNPMCVRQIWTGSQVIASNDYFQFDVWISSTSPSIVATADFVCSDGTTFASQNLIDFNQGVSGALTTDLSGLANDQWYTRQFFMTGSIVGKTITSVNLVLAGNKAGTYNAYFKNIFYQGTTQTTIFGTSLNTNAQLALVGYSNVSLSVVQAATAQTYQTSWGYSSYSGVTLIQSSLVSWQETIPDGCSIVMESSIDYGASWQAMTNGSALPNLLAGTSVSVVNLQSRATLSVGPNPVQPTFGFSSLKLILTPAYSATKTDLFQPYGNASGSPIAFSSGTLSNTQVSTTSPTTNELTLGGYAHNYNTGLLAGNGQTVYSLVGGYNGVVNKQYQLLFTVTTSGDIRSRVDPAGQWQNFICEVDIQVVSTTTSAGLVYRCTGWQSANNTFAYTIDVYTNLLTFGRGTNTSSGSGTYTNIGSVALNLSAGTTHRLKVVCNGSTHQFYIDGVLMLTKTDATWTAAGYIGFRSYNSSGTTPVVNYNNFGVSSALSGTWQSPALSLASVGTYGNGAVAWDIDGIPDTTCTISMQTSVDGGTTWQSVTNGSAIPNLTAGQSLSGKTVILKATLAVNSVATVPFLNGLSVLVLGQYTSTGYRTNAPLGNDTMIRTNVTGGWGLSTDQQTYAQNGTGTVALTSNEATISNTSGTVNMILGSQVATDTMGLVRLSLSSSVPTAGINLRFVDSNNYYRLQATTSGLTIVQKILGTAITLASFSTTLTANSFYWLRFVVQGSGPINLYGKVWADGTSEPSAWTITTTVASTTALTALTAYLTNSATTTLTTADKLVAVTGGSNTSNSSLCGTSTGFSELLSQGTGGAWAALGSIGSPSGHGWLWDTTTLEGETILAGNWTPTVRLKISAGTCTADIHMRAYKRSSGGTYTQIGSDMILSAQSLTTSSATYTFSSSSFSAVSFGTGDKLYVDVWLNITANSSGSGSAQIVLDEAGSSSQGNVTNQLVTPGYSPSLLASGGFALFDNGASGTASFDHFRVTLYPDPTQYLTNAGRAVNSIADHNSSVPANTRIDVHTSIDGGATYQPVANPGDMIPGIGVMAHYTTVRTNSPKVFCRLNEQSGSIAYDSSNNGYDGSIIGGVTLGEPGGLAGLNESSNTSMLFDGSTGYISLPSAITTNGLTAFSVECWVLPAASASDYGRVMANGNVNSSFEGFQIGVSPSAGGAFFAIGNGSVKYEYDYTTALPTTSWTQLIGVWTGSALQLYVNGILAGSVTTSGSLGSTSYPVNIGRSPDGSSYYAGQAQACSLYPTALTQTEITALYNAGSIATQSVYDDTFTSNTTANYTQTTGTGGSSSTWTWDTANSRIIASGGSKAVLLWNNVTASDVDILGDFYQSENSGLIWGWQDASDYYELVVKDANASVSPNTLTLNKISGGVSSQLATGAVTFPVLTYHRVYMTMQSGVITAFFDNVQILTYTDGSPLAGQAGLRNDTGTSYIYELQITPLAPDISDLAVYTKHTLISTDPTATPQILDAHTMASDNTFGLGVSIPSADYNQKYINDNLDDLNTQSNYTYTIDFNKSVTFAARNASNAPWILQSEDVQVAGVTVEYGADLYRNRQTLQGVYQTTSYIEIKNGDGSTRTWNVANPIASGVPTITLNGLPATVGVLNVDTGRQFYFQIGSTAISQDNGQTILQDADSFTIVYTGTSAIDFTIDNTGQFPGTISQSQLAALDKTTGVIESIEDVSQQNMNVAAATVYANQLLQRYGSIARTINFVTLHDGLQPGHNLPIFVPELNIFDSYFLVVEVNTTVQTKADGSLMYVYTVIASEAAALSSWIKLFSKIMRSVKK